MLSIELRNFRAHETLGVAMPHDASVPLPSAGDVVEVNAIPYVCHHRSFEYRGAELVRIYVMVEPDRD